MIKYQCGKHHMSFFVCSKHPFFIHHFYGWDLFFQMVGLWQVYQIAGIPFGNNMDNSPHHLLFIFLTGNPWLSISLSNPRVSKCGFGLAATGLLFFLPDICLMAKRGTKDYSGCTAFDYHLLLAYFL
jgi:hypothetical protein